MFSELSINREKDPDGTHLRFAIGAFLETLKFGQSVILDRRVVHHAFKPTGDHDRTIEGAIRAMSLAAGGHRPETSYTVEERLERDFEGRFKWFQSHETGDYHFHRPDEYCPKCKGRMFVERRKEVSLEESLWSADFDPNEASIEVERIPCDQHG